MPQDGLIGEGLVFPEYFMVFLPFRDGALFPDLLVHDPLGDIFAGLATSRRRIRPREIFAILRLVKRPLRTIVILDSMERHRAVTRKIVGRKADGPPALTGGQRSFRDPVALFGADTA